MSAKTAASVYEEHVRALPADERLRLLAMIAEDLSNGDAKAAPKRHSLAELYGIGEGVWEGVDAQEYVNQLRAEWDERSW